MLAALRTSARPMSRSSVEIIRRSAAMAPLSQSAVQEFLDACSLMAKDREQIAAILQTLSPTVAELRSALEQPIAACGELGPATLSTAPTGHPLDLPDHQPAQGSGPSATTSTM